MFDPNETFILQKMLVKHHIAWHAKRFKIIEPTKYCTLILERV